MSRTIRISACLLVCIAALTISTTINSQQKSPPESRNIWEYKPSENAKVEKDIVYARYGDRELKLDLYLPLIQAILCR